MQNSVAERSDVLAEMSENDTDEERNPEFSSDEETEEKLYKGASITTQETVIEVFEMFVKHKKTKKLLQDDLRFYQKILPENNNLPNTLSKMYSFIENHSALIDQVDFILCKICNTRKVKSDDKCSNCKAVTESETFYGFILEDFIKYLFEHRDLANVIDLNESKEKSSTDITDLQDGVEYIQIRNSLTGKYDLILMFSTDGVARCKSTNSGFWPLIVTIGNVPPESRKIFTFVIAMWCNTHKPKMNIFLKPFVESLKNINSQNGIQWTHPITKEKISSNVVSPLAIVDAPVRADLQGLVNHNGLFGCNICEQKREKNPNENEEKKCKSYFLYNANPSDLRTKESMSCHVAKVEQLKQAQKNKNKQIDVCGVKYRSVLEEVPFLDMSKFVCPEYMHSVLLGVVLHLTTLWFFIKGPWYIGDKVDQVDNFLMQIKPPDFLQRLPRSLKYLSKWKASELRSWLLFYSPLVLQKFGGTQYYQHWLLLVASIQILLSENISATNLDDAESMLNSFLKDISILYRFKDYRYNIHSLLHLPLTVLRWGPLWAISAFPYENINGFLSKMMHGTKDVGKEIMNTLQLYNSFRSLQLSQKHSLSVDNNKLLNRFKDELPLLYSEKLTQKGFVSVDIFGRAKLNNMVLTSQIYDDKLKRKNSFVKFKKSDTNFSLGEIMCFFYNKDSALEATPMQCLIREFSVVQYRYLFNVQHKVKINHIIPVAYTMNFTVVDVKNIVMKLIKVENYLCETPNKYENAL